MKLTPMLCASVVALAALAMSAEGAFAGVNDPIVGVGIGLGKKPHPSADKTTQSTPPKSAPVATKPSKGNTGGPKKQDQSTTVNTSRSNIRNN